MAKNGKTPPPIDPDYGEIPDDVRELLKKGTPPVGYSTKREDNVLPLIRLLQKGSPQVDERGGDYVDGARAGDFLFKNAPQEIIAGDVGFNFWQFGFHKNWVEWRPNRGGYVGAHLEPPPEAEWRVETNKENNRERKILALPNNNYLEETAYHYGLVNGAIWVLPFRSTGLADLRALNTAMGGLTFEDHPLDSYGAIWRITSKSRTSKDYEWYAVKFALLFHYGQRDAEGKLLMPTSMLLRGRQNTLDLAQEIGSGALGFEREESATAVTKQSGDEQEAIPF